MVKSVFNSLSKASKSRQETILSAAVVIGAIYIVSALLGFIRNRILSAYFGDSTELGLYFAADDIPNLTFSLIVSGALSTSFIPIFNRYYKKDKNEAWELTSSIINTSILIFMVIFVLVLIFAEFTVSEIIARNSNLSPGDVALYASLLRILMMAQFGFILSNFYTSILQSFNHFIIPALAPVMLNFGVIIFLILFYGKLGIYAPAYGTVFGAFLHMVIQIPYVREQGLVHKFKVNLMQKGLREIYTLMIPRTLGLTAQKLIIPLYTNLALFISGPSNVILTFADDLQSLPVRIFGVSIGQAALPIFSKAYKEEDPSEFKRLLIKTLYQVIFFILPITVLVFVLRVPLVRLAVGARKYSREATVMTAYTLAFFSISLVAQALILILSRGFYTLYDTKTPFKIATGCILINAVFAVIFVRYFGLGVWSLGLAYTTASILNAALMFFALLRKIGSINMYDFLHKINRISLSSFIMGIMLYLPLKIFDNFIFDTTRTFDLLILTAVVSLIGLITYVLLVKLFKLKELDYTYFLLKDIKFDRVTAMFKK